jgi:hypothetical protein
MIAEGDQAASSISGCYSGGAVASSGAIRSLRSTQPTPPRVV